jgi:hypothetical protein
MHSRGARGPGLYERIHGTPPGAPEAPYRADADRTPEPTARHCWVLTDTDVRDRGIWLPGLLLGWEKTPAGWRGRVARQAPASGGWVVVVDWVPSALLDRADTAHQP